MTDQQERTRSHAGIITEPLVTTAVLRDADHTTERVVLIEGVDAGTYLVALDLTRERNRRLLGRQLALVQCERHADSCRALESDVRVCAPTEADLELHRSLEQRLFPECRTVRPAEDLTVLRLETAAARRVLQR